MDPRLFYDDVNWKMILGTTDIITEEGAFTIKVGYTEWYHNVLYVRVWTENNNFLIGQQLSYFENWDGRHTFSVDTTTKIVAFAKRVEKLKVFA